MLKGHLVKITMPLYGNFDSIRQCIDHGNPYTMQTTGKLVVIGAEFPAGMQLSQDNFNPTLTIFRMDIDGHAAAVIDYFQRAVLEQGDIDALGMTGQRLVDGIVDDFVRKVIRPAGIRIHARPATNWIEAA